jgi:peptidoglycan/xylan/chitin deacetylase (PgdA/CDA1 family)
MVGKVLTRLGLHHSLLGDRGVVVTFHRVTDSYRDPLTCSIKEFASYCAFFRSHFSVIPLGEMVTRLENGGDLTRTLAVTFDDGYRDNYEFAAPTLRSLELPATFFVASEFMNSDIVAPWDREAAPPPAWMTWDQVRALHNDGFEIGAHTRTHADLGRVVGEQAEWEICGSRQDLEAQLGTTVDLFAYPFGRAENLAESNRELVRKAGFRCCASCHGGTNARGGDRFRLRRVPISPWFISPGQFALEVALGRA